MERKVWQLLRLVCFAVVLAVGVGLFALRLNAPFPEKEEARELLATAVIAEDGVSPAAWPAGVLARRTLFHVLSGGSACFFGEGAGPYPSRCYRVVPVLFGALALVSLFALGSQQSKGVYYSPDGGLWAMAFAAVTLGLIWHGVTFGPYLFEASVLLGMLLAARAYARWPGYFSAAAFGGLLATLISLDGNTWWLLIAFVPAIAIGAGWRRLYLYWQTLHVALALAVAVGVGSILAQFGLMGAPTLPHFEGIGFGESPWFEALWRFLWLCGGGFGVVAWSVLALWCWRRGDRRWARFFVILFPPIVLGTLCFGVKGCFGVATGVLSAIVLGMALSAVEQPAVRNILGGLTILALGFGLGWEPDGRIRTWLTREEQRESMHLLRQARKAPRQKPVRVRFVGGNTVTCAQMLWLLRTERGRVVQGDDFADDADILIVNEARLASVTAEAGRRVLPGVVRTGGGAQFRLFAELPKAKENKGL